MNVLENKILYKADRGSKRRQTAELPTYVQKKKQPENAIQIKDWKYLKGRTKLNKIYTINAA